MKDAWTHLKEFTAARIALGRVGGSVPTGPLLDFRLSHARARDAVLTPFEPEVLGTELEALGEEVVLLQSGAEDRAIYLRRPDYGRRLDEDSARLLKERENEEADLVLVLSDGLSTSAVMKQAVPLLEILLPMLRRDGWKLAPICVVKHGRVAVQDEIGEILNAKVSLMLLGERPGLGSPDSLGAYFTYEPKVGRSDADRNCVSNIRPEGLPLAAAAVKLCYLLNASRELKLSGVELKDESPLLERGEETSSLGTVGDGG
nr:ethanolamine ammonia-lyase subunit EutC [Phragmitibacter flavus]